MNSKMELNNLWKSRASRFNIIIILLFSFLLILEQIIFPFIISFFLIPIIVLFIIALNILYFFFGFVYLRFRQEREMKIANFRKVNKWFILINCLLILLYFANLSLDNYKTKKRNEQRINATEDWIKKNK